MRAPRYRGPDRREAPVEPIALVLECPTCEGVLPISPTSAKHIRRCPLCGERVDPRYHVTDTRTLGRDQLGETLEAAKDWDRRVPAEEPRELTREEWREIKGDMDFHEAREEGRL